MIGLADSESWTQAVSRWWRRAPEGRSQALAQARVEEGVAPTQARFTLFVRNSDWEETPRARGWVKSEALARLLAEALAEEGLACFVVADA